jgi:transposase
MGVLPPLPLMERWRLEGLSPEQVNAQADAWVKDARQALRRPIPKQPQPSETPTEPIQLRPDTASLRVQASARKRRPQAKAKPAPRPRPAPRVKPGPKPGIPKRFPPRPKDGRSHPVNRQQANRKLPDLETLVELYQTRTIQEIANIYKVGASSVGDQLKKVDAVAKKRQARKQAREQEKAQHGQERGNLKLPSTERLAELYKDHTLREIAAMHEATTEAVAYHLRKVGAIEGKRANKEAADLEQIRVMRDQGLSWEKIAKTLRRGEGYCRRLAEEAGLETLFKKPFVCSECDRNPYARGLCRRCYEWARRNKGNLSPEEQAKVKARAAMAQGPGRYHRGLRPETLERMRRVEELRRLGLTFKQIHTETGIHGSTACALLKRYERLMQGDH